MLYANDKCLKCQLNIPALTLHYARLFCLANKPNCSGPRLSNTEMVTIIAVLQVGQQLITT
jgi:hypothetical protein